MYRSMDMKNGNQARCSIFNNEIFFCISNKSLFCNWKTLRINFNIYYFWLNRKYSQFFQTNGFLYIFADVGILDEDNVSKKIEWITQNVSSWMNTIQNITLRFPTSSLPCIFCLCIFSQKMMFMKSSTSFNNDLPEIQTKNHRKYRQSQSNEWK